MLPADVRRSGPLIRYQSLVIMGLSASGVVIGRWARMPFWFVGGDAIACWAYCVPMLILTDRVERNPPGNSPSAFGRQELLAGLLAFARRQDEKGLVRSQPFAPENPLMIDSQAVQCVVERAGLHWFGLDL